MPLVRIFKNLSWKDYLPNLLETCLLHQIFIFIVRDFQFWLLACFFGWIFWSSFKTLYCRVGPLDSFEGSSSPGPTLTGQGPRTPGPKSAGNTIWLKIWKFTFFAWAISLSWNFWSSFKTLDCRVGPLDFFEGSSSPGPTLTGQGPCWGLPQRFGTIFWRFLMKLGIVGLCNIRTRTGRLRDLLGCEFPKNHLSRKFRFENNF